MLLSENVLQFQENRRDEAELSTAILAVTETTNVFRYSDNVEELLAERRIARVSPYLGYQNIKEPSAVSDV
jgi:hypothetical protein